MLGSDFLSVPEVKRGPLIFDIPDNEDADDTSLVEGPMTESAQDSKDDCDGTCRPSETFS